MEFSFTEEQEMIRESAVAFLSNVSTSEAVRKMMATELGYDPSVWQRIAQEMVWPALHIPEEYGGMGLGYVELVALLEQMGKHLLCSPFFSTVCLAANALLLSGNAIQKETYLTKIAKGSLTASLAFSGKNNLQGADAITCTYTQENDVYTLNGEYCYVPNGHSVELIIVAARNSDSDDISLFLLNADAKGLTRTYTPTMDQTKKQASLVLNNVAIEKADLLGDENYPTQAKQVLEQTLQLANIAIAAEQLGGTQKVLDLTVEYTKERIQFNRSIASFQAVKHKAADMMLKAECAKSATYYAACIAQEFFENKKLEQRELASELAEAASIAKSYCSDAYFFNAGCAIQLFGGVGFTWEYDIHLFFKRAKSSESYLGNGAQHREQLAKILLD
jgi:alkylation response protein AidB-like acyl-CoA dehydrogenase